MDDGYDSTTVRQSSQRADASSASSPQTAGSSAVSGTGRDSVSDTGRDWYEGEGWVAFAGIMIAIVGVLDFIYGIAAISNSRFYVHGVNYIISDLNTWGWVIMITGVIQFCAAVAIFGRVEWGRWVGVATAAVNSIIQLIFIPAYPFGSLALFAIDILVIYGLVAYGGRQGRVA
jgi:hypothetical protein